MVAQPNFLGLGLEYPRHRPTRAAGHDSSRGNYRRRRPFLPGRLYQRQSANDGPAVHPGSSAEADAATL